MSTRRPPSRSSMRFDDFHDLEARRDSVGCINNDAHRINAGDLIGWSRRHRSACCADCWQRWSVENADAAMQESGCWD